MLREIALKTSLVPSPAHISVLTPPDYTGDADHYPLLLFLHGGDGDNGFLRRMEPLFDDAWRCGHLPPLIVATPDADRSFYLDYFDGSEMWERFITGELLGYLRSTFLIANDARNTVLAGISMGGMGALRMAFKFPDLFGAVAALEPGIEPALSFATIDPKDRFWRDDELFAKRYGRPVNEQHWQSNNPANIVMNSAARLRESGLQVYLEVGDEDSFNLYRGAEFLHRVLYDEGIKHEYRLLRGADHVGASLPGRFQDAFRFLGRALRPAGPDSSLKEFHKFVARLKQQAGLEE